MDTLLHAPHLLILLLVSTCLLISVGIVCVQDAKRRGKSPILVVILVLSMFPLGLVIWLLFRPAPKTKDTTDFDINRFRKQ